MRLFGAPPGLGLSKNNGSLSHFGHLENGKMIDEGLWLCQLDIYVNTWRVTPLSKWLVKGVISHL